MNPNKEWKYELNRRGRVYVIHLMEHDNGVSVGTPVYQSSDYEKARKELYRLNGWKYKPKRNNKYGTTEN